MSFFLRIQKKIQQLSLLGYGNTTCFCLFLRFSSAFFSSKSHLNLYKIRSGEKCSTEKKRRWRKIRVETHCKLTTQRHPIQRLPRPPLHTHIHMRTFVLVKKNFNISEIAHYAQQVQGRTMILPMTGCVYWGKGTLETLKKKKGGEFREREMLTPHRKTCNLV